MTDQSAGYAAPAALRDVLALLPRHRPFSTYGHADSHCHQCYEAGGWRHIGAEWPCTFERVRVKAEAVVAQYDSQEAAP